MLLEIKDGTVLQNGIPVLSHFDFWIRGNERAAIVGRNGAGKTTLLEVITGAKELEPNPKNPASEGAPLYDRHPAAAGGGKSGHHR